MKPLSISNIVTVADSTDMLARQRPFSLAVPHEVYPGHTRDVRLRRHGYTMDMDKSGQVAMPDTRLS